MKMQMIRRGDGSLAVFGRNEAMKNALRKIGHVSDPFRYAAPCWARNRLSECERFMLVLLEETDELTANISCLPSIMDRPELLN